MEKIFTPTKIVVTFNDGHTEEYDTFLACVVVEGKPILLPDGVAYEGTTETKIRSLGCLHTTTSLAIQVMAALQSNISHFVNALPERDRLLTILAIASALDNEEVIKDETELTIMVKPDPIRDN